MEQARILTITLNPALDLSTETDHVRPEEKLRCAPPRSQPGGGGVNVSRAIAHLGGTSRALVAAGGHEGRMLMAGLQQAGLAPLRIPVSGATRSSLAVTDRGSGHQFRFVMPGPRWSADDLDRARAAIALHLRAGDLVVPSGSLPPGVPPAFFSDLAGDLAQAPRMILDTSGAALRAAARGQGLHSLRMDEAEAAELADMPMLDPARIAGFARHLLARKVAGAVLIAAGARGNVIAHEGGCWLTAPPRVGVVSKVGAGDSFVAAYTLALARGATRLEACIQGTGAAAAAVETPDTDLCEKEAAEAHARAVRVTPL